MLQYKPLGEALTVVIAGELDHYAAPQIRHMLDDLLNGKEVTHHTVIPTRLVERDTFRSN